jgi:hypothetical protein
MTDLPILQKVYDLICWYVPILDRLPRNQKFALGDRLTQNLYDLGVLRAAKPQLEEYVAGLRLKLHPGKTRLQETNMGMNFLGFRILPDRLRVLNDNLRKGRRRLRELTDDYAEGNVSKEEIKQFVQSWFAHLDHGDTWRVRQQMLADLYWFGIDLDL